MKKGLFYAMALVGVLATSCSKHENIYDSDYADKQYAANWKTSIGDIDPNQTWNTATSRSAGVSVNYGTNETYTVKVYTSDPRNTTVDAYLLAEYAVKDGTSATIQFDVPTVLGTVYVACIDAEGNRIVRSAAVKDGMQVDFKLGAISKAATDWESIIGWGEKKEFLKQDCEEFLKIIPESKNNTGKVAQDFSYFSIGKFTIYPMYSVTSGENRLGLYYYDADGNMQRQIIWEGTTEKNNIEKYKDGNWINYVIGANSPWYENGVTKLRAKGVTIDLPLGTNFGFYITNRGQYYYSDVSLNTNGRAHAATFYVGDNLYIGFEDWGDVSSDFDFNDVVCYIAPIHPEIVDKDPVKDKKMQYRIAYEDLGGTNDFDFNDVVLGVEYVSGQSKATVKLLAAGGTLPVSVSYNGKTVFEEVHAAFGESTFTMINTGHKKIAQIPEVEIDVDPTKFSMVLQASMFSIGVRREAGIVNEISVPNRKGEAPQAFVVADPNWEWPSESQAITDKYADFAKWASDLKHEIWYNSTWGNKEDAIEK